MHRRTRAACTCLALREQHGALCCLSHIACWTAHNMVRLLRRIVCCAPHGASAARAAHEPPSSEPGNAQAGPRIRGAARLGASHPACRGRGLNCRWRRVDGGCSMPRRVRHACGTSHTVPWRRPCPPDWSRLPRRTRRLHCSSCAGPGEVGRGVQDDQSGSWTRWRTGWRRKQNDKRRRQTEDGGQIRMKALVLFCTQIE